MVIISTSILSMEAVLESFPVARQRRSTLVVDVLSVKARACSVAPWARRHGSAPAPTTAAAYVHMLTRLSACVQVFPKNLLLNKLPPSCDILCLHPMFGPESGKNAWTGLPLVYDRVRVRPCALTPSPGLRDCAAAEPACSRVAGG